MEAFVAHQISLINKEKKFEVEESSRLLSVCTPIQLQKRGLALIGLKVTGMRTGLGGKSLIELELANPTSDPPTLPAHKIRTGDIIGLEEHASAKQGNGGKKATQASQGALRISGVVFRVTETRVTVALSTDDEVPAEVQERCRIVKLANNVTYERMNYALQELQSHVKSGDTSTVTQPLIRALFNLQEPKFPNPPSEIVFFDETLNESQRGAVQFALGAEEIALIHGPPGFGTAWNNLYISAWHLAQTGKTYTLVEIVRQLVKDGKRVLVCGPSNISVDNLVERLSRHRLKLVRLGHPARILPAVLDHSLDVITRTSDAGQIVADIRRDMDRTLAAITKSKSRPERKALYGELKELRKDFKVRERKVVEDVVRGSRVVMATLNGCGGKNMFKEEFDVVVIDEATQALEAECWIAILKGKKLILAGDHLQLSPTVKSQTQILSTTTILSASHALSPSHVTLSTTLFDRLLSLYGSRVNRMLTIQYRMHDVIMRFPSVELYDGRLVADPSVAKRLLCQIEGIHETEDTSVPVVFVDTAGCGMEEGREEEVVGEGESKWNEGEVGIVVKHIEALVKAGVREEDVGVITPYTAQVGLLVKAVRERWPGVEVGSVDGFQGREKEAIIVSLVRSNSEGEIGFLAEKRRLNVAMTRPKRHLCIVGDSGMFDGSGGKNAGNKKKDKAAKSKGSGDNGSADGGFLRRWIEWVNEEAEVRYADYL